MSDTAPRNPVGAPQMLADALLRSVAGTSAQLRITGTNPDTNMSEAGTGFHDLCGSDRQPGGDAQAAAHVAGRQ